MLVGDRHDAMLLAVSWNYPHWVLTKVDGFGGFFLFFGGLALLLVFRTLGSRLLFPKSNLVKEIYTDNNLGAAAIMAVAYILIATVIVLSF